jgi:hypothetical protein
MDLFRQGLYWSLGAATTAAAAAAVYVGRDLFIRVLIALFLAISLDPGLAAEPIRLLARGPEGQR